MKYTTIRQMLRVALILTMATTVMTACSNDSDSAEKREKEDTHTATPDTASQMGDTATYEQMPLKTNDSIPK